MRTTAVFTATAKTQTDLLVVGVFAKDKPGPETLKFEPSLDALFRKVKQQERFGGKLGESFSSYLLDSKKAHEVVFVGLGERKSYSLIRARKAFGQVTRLIQRHKVAKARIVLESFTGSGVKLQEAASVSAEINKLVAYDFNKYKAKAKKQSLNVELLLSRQSFGSSVKEAISRAEKIAEATLFARDLVNEPANVLNATELTRRARKMAQETGLGFKVYGPAELKKMKMGGILAVNQGSLTPPALIQMEHGKRYQSKGTICLVGKGVTFDTGGLSIKPAKGMEKMKYDMAGSAAVIGAMKAIGSLKLPVHVISLTPAVENNVNNDPIRPGDIIKMYNGKTVEVLNTDAEGRLILADALAFSAKFSPKAIVDLATLTGMCLYTFGGEAIGVMGNNSGLMGKIKLAGETVGERCWELPMWEEYGKQIKGTQSDLKNIGGMYGGTITAAKFLEEFVPAKTPWVHMDIAGAAWAEAARYDAPVGATGVGVRLLTEFVSKK